MSEPDDDRGAERRHLLRMVDDDFAQTAGMTGVSAMSPAVRAAIGAVPRHRFVPPELDYEAYDNRPLPIGQGQTISQPYIVALMTELLAVAPDHRVLEVGTGCGYQTAVLARLATHVHSIEIVPELHTAARARLAALGVHNVSLRLGDGGAGWPEAAPFDRIVVTAAPHALPTALVEQLRPGGRMVLPMGSAPIAQDLYVVDKATDGRVTARRTIGVRFVPLTGGAELE